MKLTARRQLLTALVVMLGIAVIFLFGWYLHNRTFEVLAARGPVAHQERNLIYLTTFLIALVVVPVFVMTIVIAWRYREGNSGVKYAPDWDHNPVAETVWWGLPFVIIAILSVVAWNSSHSLDPYKSLASSQPTLDIQVVALDWKWLFIYPDQNLATVNFMQIPVGTPVHFSITADAPMNSFWIPQLGGQIYAMPGMVTELNLLADQPGDFNGASANISGRGFAGMKFIARASSMSDFDRWVSQVKQSPTGLTKTVYNQLAQPSTDNPPSSFSFAQANIFDGVISKFITPPDFTYRHDGQTFIVSQNQMEEH